MIDQIINQAIKFPSDQPVTHEAKEVIKGMMHKDPTKRLTLLDVMNTHYYMMDDEELEEQITIVKAEVVENKKNEEEKAEKQWESDILLSI